MAGTVELAGIVTSEVAETSIWDDPARFYIRVSGTEFEVTSSLYRGVEEGAEVVLTINGFNWGTNLGDLNNKVTTIRRTRSSTAFQWFVPEPERRTYAPFGNRGIRVMTASDSVWKRPERRVK